MNQSLTRAIERTHGWPALRFTHVRSINNLSGKTYPVEVAVAVAQYSDRAYFHVTSFSWIPKINSNSSKQTEKSNNTL